MTKHLKELTMRRFTCKVAAIAAVLALWAGAVSAQTTLTNTTLSAAITNANDQVMTIASATGWTASTSAGQTFAVIDREVVGVRSLSSTQVGIIRGLFGTRATGHISGAKVWFIPVGSVAISSSDRAGACSTAGNADLSQSGAVVPVLNPLTGNAFYCAGGSWNPVALLMGTASCTVTQQTNRTTGATCTGMSGVITTNNASLAAEAAAEFTVTDTAVALGDVVVVAIQSGPTAATPKCLCRRSRPGRSS
jgi:hypothetical protein